MLIDKVVHLIYWISAYLINGWVAEIYKTGTPTHLATVRAKEIFLFCYYWLNLWYILFYVQR